MSENGGRTSDVWFSCPDPSCKGFCFSHTAGPNAKNPGRRYFRCSMTSCSFFIWADMLREIVNCPVVAEIKRENDLLRNEITRLKEELESLRRHTAQNMDATATLAKAIGKLVLKD
jgi:hypothetical protein